MPSYGSKGQPQFAGSDAVALDQYLTSVGTYAALVGNRISGTQSQFNSFTPTYGFSPFDGLEFFQTDTGNQYVWRGSNWVGIKSQSGGVAFAAGDFTASGGGFQASRAVAFANGRFTANPVVTFGVFTSAAQDQHAGVAAISPTGFTLYYWRANQTATTIGWTASPSDS